jgi:hypothetical protein
LGAVQIHFGSSAGLPTAGDVFLTQDTPGVPGNAASLHIFGFSLACGDFNADSFDDLVVGVPGERLGSNVLSLGRIVAIPGSAGGLVPRGASSFDQDSSGMADGAEANDLFGFSLATGDFNGDSFDDVAIGVPGENNSGTPETGKGAIQIVFGSASGLTSAGNLLRTESGVGGTSEAGDRFGYSLAAGDFDGDSFDDLAIGIPFEDLGGVTIVDAGQVVVVNGAAAGFDFARHQNWFQENVIGVGTSEADDRFGFALAVGDFDRDGRADLAAGSPGEFQLVSRDGVVTVWSGTPVGLSAARNRSFDRGYKGVPGPINQSLRNFGQTLACGDFDGDGHADLVMGAPFANESFPDVGDEVVVYGALFADGFETADAALWSSVAP